MIETRENILARIKAKLPVGADSTGIICEESTLAELGVSSLHLITLLLALQREYSLEMGGIAKYGMPTTMGDLVTLLERGGPVK
jgi:acyl carrier protein